MKSFSLVCWFRQLFQHYRFVQVPIIASVQVEALSRVACVDIRFMSMRTCARIYLCKHQAEQDRGMRGTSRGIAGPSLRFSLGSRFSFVSFPLPSFASDFSRRRGRSRVVAPIVADDSDGRPCGLLLYHRHGETCDGGQ